MPEKPPLFTVTDRRKFTTEGQLREGRPAEEPAPAPPAATPSVAAPAGTPENFATPETASSTGGPGLHLVGTEGRVDDNRLNEEEDNQTQSRNPGTSAPGTLTSDSATSEAQSAANDGGLYKSEIDAQTDEAQMDEAQMDDDGLGPEPTAAETAEQHQAYRRSSDLIDDMVQQANPGAPPAAQMDFEQLVQSIYVAAIVAMGAGEQGQKPRIDIIGARQSIDMLAVLAEKTTGNLNPQEQRLLQSALFNLRMMFLEITNALAAQAKGQPTRGPVGGPTPPNPRGPGK